MIGFCATLFSLLISAYPFVDVVNPLVYAAKILGTVAFSNLIGFAFYKLRTRERKKKQKRDYSYRRAFCGSILVARHAGTQQARKRDHREK